MKKRGLTLFALAFALLALPLQSVGASNGGAAGATSSSDAAAIAKFLSIGFANAHNNFSTIRGARVDQDEFVALTWPDRSHFQSCHTWHFPADKLLGAESYMYSCNSTARSTTSKALFDTAAKAVQANLPGCYTSKGREPSSDRVFQEWDCSGRPKVKLWAFASKGKPYYELSMELYPASKPSEKAGGEAH